MSNKPTYPNGVLDEIRSQATALTSEQIKSLDKATAEAKTKWDELQKNPVESVVLKLPKEVREKIQRNIR